jgi:hypothetical protein
MSNVLKTWSSRRLRFEVLERDKFSCRYCGTDGRHGPLRIDHVVPLALGGTNDWENLVTCCHACNAGKGATRIRRLPPGLKKAAARTRYLDAAAWDVANILWPKGTPSPQPPRLRAIRILIESSSVQHVRKAAMVARRELPDPKRRLEICSLLCWRGMRQVL